MKKIRFIFCFLVVALLSVSFFVNDEPEVHCPLEELAEEVEAGINPLLKDVEDDVAYVKNTRRVNSENNESITEEKTSYQFSFGNLLQMEKKRKISYATDFELWHHDEISFLHRFRLF